MAGSFKFVGKVELNKLDARVAPYREGVTSGQMPYASFNMSVVPEKNNRAFVEAFGMKRSEISTINLNGENITVNWDDREDPEIIKTVAFFKRYTIEMNGERHEFITDYDFVKFLISNYDTIKGKTFIVKGQIKPNVYNGKVSLRYNFNYMSEVTADSDVKPGMSVSNIYYYSKDDIDTADWTKDKIINVNGYTSQYFDKDIKNKYVLTPFVIDCSKADFNNPDIVKKLAFKLQQLGISLKDNSINVLIKKDAIVSIPAECTYINGSEQIPFDESQLTANQKMAVELGINTLEDFRPKGVAYGESVTVLKYKKSDLRSPYEDGYKLEEITLNDFQDLIFKKSTSETVDDLNKKVEEPKDDDIDSLFS